MMKRATAVAVVAMLFGIAAVAQQPADKPAQKGGQMSMDDMMAGCREHCQASMKSMDQMAKAMADAKASNDPAKMRAALDQAEKPLTDMREHMSMCMNMMNMMQKMHGGGMGGMMGGMMSGDQIKVATSTSELANLCEGKVSAADAPRATYQGRIYYFCSQAD